MRAERNRARGKQHQRKVAEKLKGLNLGTLGGVDVLTDKFAVECKSRQKFVAINWFEQAVKNANGKTPIVVIHIVGKRYDNDFVMIRMKDFLTLIEKGGGNGVVRPE